MTGRGPASRRSRRGSVYVLVLSMSTLLVVVAVSGLLVERVRQRSAGLEQGWHESGLLAQAAVEHAVDGMKGPWWRDEFAAYDNAFGPEIPLGGGSIRWRLEDLIDSQLDDSADDPLRVHGLGRVGDAVRVLSVVAWPSGLTLDALRTPVHATGAITVGGTADVRDGPLSTNTGISGGQVLGDVEALSVDPGLIVTGSITIDAPEKPVPGEALWEVYKAQATSISFNGLANGTIRNVVLGPERNPWDADKTNAQGIYHISVPSFGQLRIFDARISGTLVVELKGGARLRVEENVLWAPATAGLPALVVLAQAIGSDVDLESSGELDEFLLATNFNPPDVPYYGEADLDVADAYPAGLRGLFHVIRTEPADDGMTSIMAPQGITGCVLADGEVEIIDGSKLTADPALLSVPPLGYTTAVRADNLLQNGGMENGLTAWAPVGATTTLSLSAGAHSGEKLLKIDDRASAADGARQDVTSVLESGATYASTLWVRMEHEPDEVEVRIVTETADEGVRTVGAVVPADTDWTYVAVELTPTWTGPLVSAHWIVTTTTTNRTIKLDDVSLTPVTVGVPVADVMIVPGTWRAEAAPD